MSFKSRKSHANVRKLTKIGKVSAIELTLPARQDMLARTGLASGERQLPVRVGK